MKYSIYRDWLQWISSNLAELFWTQTWTNSILAIAPSSAHNSGFVAIYQYLSIILSKKNTHSLAVNSSCSCSQYCIGILHFSQRKYLLNTSPCCQRIVCQRQTVYIWVCCGIGASWMFPLIVLIWLIQTRLPGSWHSRIHHSGNVGKVELKVERGTKVV